jgi:hypothetical protein
MSLTRAPCDDLIEDITEFPPTPRDTVDSTQQIKQEKDDDDDDIIVPASQPPPPPQPPPKKRKIGQISNVQNDAITKILVTVMARLLESVEKGNHVTGKLSVECEGVVVNFTEINLSLQ